MSTNNLEVGLSGTKYFYANPDNQDIEAKNARDGTGDFINISGKAPTQAQHFVTKDYFDGALAGLAASIVCQAATTTNIDDLYTGLENGDVLDGVFLSTGNYILINNQTDQTQNGVYTVMESGAPCRISAEDIADGVIVSVENGTVNQATYWVSNGSYTGGEDTYPVYDVDNITFGSTSIYPNAFVGPKIYVETYEPNSSNDNTEGYKIGDVWVDSDNESGFICVDAATSDAAWAPIGAEAVGTFGCVQWADGEGDFEADPNFSYNPDNGELQVPISINNLFGNLIYQTDDGSITIGNSSYSENELVAGDNTVIGYLAYDNQYGGGTDNAIIGYRACETNDSGSFNVVIGSYAGNNIEGGNNNIVIGYQAFVANQFANNCVVIGYSAMSNHNGSGGDNIAIGYESLYNADDGQFNVAIGSSALYNNYSGTNNLAIGYQALNAAENSSGNIALGTSALYAFNYGDGGNVAIGFQALETATDAQNCIAIGFQSMAGGANGGSDNIGIGYQTLLNINAGTDNIAIGGYSLFTNATGNSNVSVGFTALYTLDAGDNNVAVGVRSLYTLTGSSDNIGLGNFSGENQTSGSQNLIVGCYAGNGFLSGDNNVFLGYNAAPSLTNGSNNIVIGSGFDITDETDNQINIGGVFVADTSGNVTLPANLYVVNDILINNNTGYGGTPGSCVDQFPIYNSTGTLLGYIPIYSSIS